MSSFTIVIELSPLEPQPPAPRWSCRSLLTAQLSWHCPEDFLAFSGSLSPGCWNFFFLLYSLIGWQRSLWKLSWKMKWGEIKVLRPLMSDNVFVCPYSGLILCKSITFCAENDYSSGVWRSFHHSWLPVLLLRSRIPFWFSPHFISSIFISENNWCLCTEEFEMSWQSALEWAIFKMNHECIGVFILETCCLCFWKILI